ncbi:hypothetical protein [Clostridium sp. HBUAS56017]|uniref:hypothetical protein n=1 Tax=Clostridium sp. HBUAS56017 TaxID=2571128 RepID=UPI001A9B5C27|nr:hypothetical protein [Clostridium sp. HBUAS56017]
MKQPNKVSIINSNLSITDETIGWYYGDNKIYPLDYAEISEKDEGLGKKLCIKFQI